MVHWGEHHATGAQALLSERAVLLARTREELASLPKLRDSAAVLTRAVVALAPQVLSGSTSAEAGADLSGRMSLAASRAPARVDRVDPLPDSSGAGRLGRVIAFLRAIDAGDEVLTLDELRIVALEPGAPERGPEVLKVEVTIGGWYIKARDSGLGTRGS